MYCMLSADGKEGSRGGDDHLADFVVDGYIESAVGVGLSVRVGGTRYARATITRLKSIFPVVSNRYKICPSDLITHYCEDLGSSGCDQSPGSLIIV